MEKIEILTLIILAVLMVSPIYFFDLITMETVIQVGSTFWFQLFSVFGLTGIAMYFGEFLKWIDISIAYLLTGMFDHWFERKIVAPVRILSKEWVKPGASIAIDRNKIGHITQVTALEAWLTHHPIDYSFFWDYHIDSNEAKKALSRVLAKVPIIGGVWRKMDKERLGIDHVNPRIEFLVCETDLIPSTKDSDFKNENWYGKFMNGINHKFPYPEQEAVFKVSIIYYKNESKQDCTMFAIGCSHALTDGDGFFMLMRAWSCEMKGEKWIVPSFDRTPLIIKDSELKKFKPDFEVNGKHFDYNTRPTSWVSTAIWPSRRWTVKTWKFTKQDISKWKAKALSGSHGEQLKSMRLSTNDIIVALFWKIRATLNRDYEFDHPVICSLALNTRSWIPHRFPEKHYFGNGLAFVLLHKTRRELIESDFSKVCYFVRSEVASLKAQSFEDDLHFYPYILKRSPDGVDTLHRYHTRWAVPGYGFDHGRYLMDRDLLISNLTKLPTLDFDMGNGDPSRVRFNFQDEANQMGYAFKLDNNLDEIEYFGAIPTDDVSFFEKYDLTDASIDWNEINKYHATETRRWAKQFPGRRLAKLNFSALFDGRKDTKFWNW